MCRPFPARLSLQWLCSFLLCLLERCEAVWGPAVTFYGRVIGKPPTLSSHEILSVLLHCLLAYWGTEISYFASQEWKNTTFRELLFSAEVCFVRSLEGAHVVSLPEHFLVFFFFYQQMWQLIRTSIKPGLSYYKWLTELLYWNIVCLVIVFI